MPGARTRSLLEVLWQAVRLSWSSGRRRVLLVAALQGAAALLVAAQVLLGRVALQAVLDADSGRTGVLDAVPALVALVLAGVLTGLTGPLLLLQQRVLAEMVQRHVQSQVLDVTESVELVRFESPAFFDRLQRVTTHAATRSALVVSGFVQLAGGLAVGGALLVALLALEPLLVLILLPAAVPLLALSGRGGRLEFAFALSQTPAVRAREQLRLILTGRGEAKEVRAFGAASFLRSAFDARYDRYLTALAEHARRRLRLALLSTAAVAVSTTVTLVALLVLVVEERIELAEAGAALIAVRLLAGRLEAVATAVGRLLESSLFLRDLDGFRRLGAQVAPGERGGPDLSGTVLRAEAVTFAYPSSRGDAVHGVDLELRCGEVVALVGENGCGKTTLLKILAGLYTPSKGTVRWDDGVDAPGALRARATVVFQDHVRYALPAHDNVALGRRTDPADVEASARGAEVHELLAGLPLGYDTVLSAEFEGGTDLSGGQWQRVALARALHRPASLILLDEPSSALDPLAEAHLLDRLRTQLHDRAVLVVSHRLSTVLVADRVCVMRDGRVVETGTHDQLLNGGGHYAALFGAQAGRR